VVKANPHIIAAASPALSGERREIGESCIEIELGISLTTMTSIDIAG
jgi:hypothetical protein